MLLPRSYAAPMPLLRQRAASAVCTEVRDGRERVGAQRDVGDVGQAPKQQSQRDDTVLAVGEPSVEVGTSRADTASLG
jgi:hypothetical protein